MATRRGDLDPIEHSALVGVRWIDGAAALIVSGEAAKGGGERE